jgi:NAD(P)-dependent dehydrogenase (short-subunit alcohol dehydrogenase family)
MDLTDRHIIITGGTGSLGSAVAELLLESGARISIPCYDEAELEDFALQGHDHLFIRTGIDLTEEEITQNFYADAVDALGSLWGSIHIAGGFGMGTIKDSSKADFMKQINMNLVSCYNSCRFAVLHMKEAGEGGRIVNIAARPALEPRQGAGMSAYTTAKAGVAALTESLAAELVKDNILVNAIAPSVIDTPQNRKAMSEADFHLWPKPEEIARQIKFLVSPVNKVTRGAIIPVYGKS